jgi:hypothetical protein
MATPLHEHGWADFIRIDTSIDIGRSAEEVFDFVTTPALWHTWHPATASVSEVPSRPLKVGETVVEHIRVGPRRFDARWVVVTCDPFREWMIEAVSVEGSARLRYRLEPIGADCRFNRTLGFRSKRWPWTALDSNLIRWALDRQSARALRALKGVLERTTSTG